MGREDVVEANRRGTAIAGVLVIVGMIAGALSIVPVLDESDYLALLATHETEIILGAGVQFMMIPAYVGFALCLYPTLKIGNEALSLGFVGFRLIAGMFHFVGLILLVLFVVLVQGPGQPDGPDAAHLEVLGELLRTGRDLVNHVALILALSIGDLLLFRILHQWRLVPRWLSGWGFLGIGLTMSASFMVLFRLTHVVTPLYLAMNAPLASQSLVLAVWLITRGFDTSSLGLGRAERAFS
jgi:hypothetical protein